MSEQIWPDLFSPSVTVKKIEVFEIGPDDPAQRTPGQEHVRSLLDARQQITKRERDFMDSMDDAALALTMDELRAFTAHYAMFHSLTKAADIVGKPVVSFMHRREIDLVFDRMLKTAKQLWLDELEETAMDRATATVDAEKSGPANEALKYMVERIDPSPAKPKDRSMLQVQGNGITFTWAQES